MIKTIIMAVVGMMFGWFVPLFAQKLIDYKGRQKKRSYPENPLYQGLICKIICAVISAVGYGVCGYMNPSWVLLVLVGIIWILGMITIIVDLRIRIIANEVILALLGLSIIFRIVLGGFGSLLNSLLTMIVVMIGCIILGKIMGLWKVGAGDVKLFGVIGFLYGYPDVCAPALLMAATLLAYCVIGLKTYRITMKTMFAMAPFLVAGMLLGLTYIFR